MKTLKLVAFILVIVGAINWGLVGLFNYDLVVMILGMGTMATKIVYDLVGLAGIYLLIIKLKKMS